MNQLIEHPTAAKTVIAAMLQDEHIAMQILGEVQPDDFSQPMHQLIVHGVQRAMHNIEPYDIKLVSECITQHLRENRLKLSMPPTLLESMVSEDSQRWRGYIATVKRFAQYRRAIEFAERVQNEITGYADMDELYPQLVKWIDELHEPSVTELVTLGKDTMGLYNHIMGQRVHDNQQDNLKLFDYPWNSWNEHIKPLRPGLMGIIAAPDGMGKSSALEQIAEYWAIEHQVVFVHCENDIDYTLDRRKARLTGIDIGLLETGNLTGPQTGELSSYYKPWFDNLHYVDGSGKTADQILAEVDGLHAQGLCDALVIDYLNKIRPSRGQAKLFAGKAYDVVGDNTERLKSAGVRGRYPVLTAAQMIKSAQDANQFGDRLTRNKMRGSGELSDKVQLVLTLSREILDQDVTTPQGELVAKSGEYSPKAYWRIDKQNRGRTGDFSQKFIGPRFMFQDHQNVFS